MKTIWLGFVVAAVVLPGTQQRAWAGCCGGGGGGGGMAMPAMPPPSMSPMMAPSARPAMLPMMLSGGRVLSPGPADMKPGMPPGPPPEPEKPPEPKPPSPENLYAASNAIDAAKRAIEAGDGLTALAELDKAKAALEPKQPAPEAVPTGYLNSHCPVTGRPIDPSGLMKIRVQEYNGKKVAFCSGSCPLMWAVLDSEQKDTRLKEDEDAK